MKFTNPKFLYKEVGKDKRVLVTSDIHGHCDWLEELLSRAKFTNDDILVIVGDIIQKGPENLKTLRYVMDLCQNDNVTCLMGNVDDFTVYCIYSLSEDNAEWFYNFNSQMRDWYGSSLFFDMALECGYDVRSAKQALEIKDEIMSRFKKELDFIAYLPVVLETENYVFVHGGLREKNVEDNEKIQTFNLTKYDNFMWDTPHKFDKYVMVGHWPVRMYDNKIMKLNPVIDKEKKIISMDGGCGITTEGQLNMMILPSIDCDIESVSHISCDGFPKVRVLNSQKESEDSINISWSDRWIKILEKSEETSYVEHTASGRKLTVPNSYLWGEDAMLDYTDYELPLNAGDVVKLIKTEGNKCLVKKDGMVGWYTGRYENV